MEKSSIQFLLEGSGVVSKAEVTGRPFHALGAVITNFSLMCGMNYCSLLADHRTVR